MSLREYQRKRDFRKTREPAGKEKRGSSGARFVIQKHDASRLHYDFRLEIDGVLKSWAVPKGLPAKTGEKHLAVQVEDHPLEYADFEGIIPRGEYGGGTVMLWDTGTFEAEGAREGIEAGKLHFVLAGKKCQGEWALIRMAKGEQGNEWLIFKADPDTRAISQKKDDESVKSGRTMKQIAADEDAVWHSEPEAKPDLTAVGRKVVPAFVPLMLAKLFESPPPAEDWLYEIKFDGYRALAIRKGKSLSLLSRNQKTLKFPEVETALLELPGQRFTIDGEVVAMEDGRPSFQALQRRDEREVELAFYAFDLLNLDDHDLRGRWLEERRALLEKLIAEDETGLLRFSGELEGEGEKVLESIRKMKMEGIIAKRRGSRYESGKRTGAWRKIKCIAEQEFVIGGFTPPGGSRKHFGALLLGYRKGKSLKYAGKVGTGFNAKTLAALSKTLNGLIQKTPPFHDLADKAEVFPPAERKRCTWVKPELVAQVRFTEWTEEGALRHPAFLGLREDKDPRKVVREKAG